MKKLTLCLSIVMISSLIYSQDTLNADTVKIWDAGGLSSVTFSQISFSDWATGGDNSLTGLFSLNLFANYTKDKLNWANTLDLNMTGLKYRLN